MAAYLGIAALFAGVGVATIAVVGFTPAALVVGGAELLAAIVVALTGAMQR